MSVSYCDLNAAGKLAAAFLAAAPPTVAPITMADCFTVAMVPSADALVIPTFLGVSPNF
jgi:hypothetical protein